MVELAEEHGEPPESHRPVNEEAKDDIANLAFMEHSQNNGDHRNHLACPSHAQIKVAPAAVMIDYVPRL